MKVKSLTIDGTEFEGMFETASDFDPKTGLGKLEAGDYQFLFVKDDESDKKACYAFNNSKDVEHLNPNAHFIVNVNNDLDDKIVFAWTNSSAALSGNKKRSMKVDKTETNIDKIVSEFAKIKDDSLSLYKEIAPKHGAFTTKEVKKENVNYFVAEKADATKDNVYFVTAEHWKEENRKRAGKNGKTLYMITEDALDMARVENIEALLSVKNGTLADSLKKAGAVAVKEVVENKRNGQVEVTYYDRSEDGKLTDDNKTNLLDTEVAHDENLKTWIDKNYGTGKAEYAKGSVLATGIVKHRVAVTVASVALAAVLAIGHFTASGIVKSNRAKVEEQTRIQLTLEAEKEAAKNKEEAIKSIVDETAKAKESGNAQMKNLVSKQDAFRVVERDGKKVVEMADASEIVKQEIKTYTQKSWPTYKNAEGKTVAITIDDLTDAQKAKLDYTQATIEGAYEYLGKTAVADLAADGYTVANRDIEGKYSANLVYVVGTVGSASEAYLSKANMTSYVSEFVGENAENAVEAYETGYLKEFEALMSKGEIKEENVISQSVPVVEPIDYLAPEITTALSYKTGDVVMPFYVDNKTVFAMSTEGSEYGAGNAVYKLELQDSADVSNAENLVDAITNSSNVTSALSAKYLFEGVGYDEIISNFENDFASANFAEDSTMYIFNSKLTRADGKWSVNPDILMVSNGGNSKVTIIDNNVKVTADNKDVRDQYEMLALALFGDSVTSQIYSCEVLGEAGLTNYSSNQIEDNTRAVVAEKDEGMSK